MKVATKTPSQNQSTYSYRKISLTTLVPGADIDHVAPHVSQNMSDSEVMVELPPCTNSHPHQSKNIQKKMDKMKQSTHVIMINQSGVPTVVSSGGGGHVQHVSVVGHVQHVTGPYDSAMAMSGSDSDELTAKKKASSFKITNVYVSRPPSNDGDDSCDDLEDLEDSHTEVQVL